MAVKEQARPSLMRRIAQRVLRKRTLAAFAAAALLVLIFHYLVLPWLVRDRVRAALDEAGLGGATFRVTRATLWATDVRDIVFDDVNRVEHVRVRYDVRDLWHREVREVIVTGATVAADPDAWPVEKKQTPATATATTVPKKAAFTLPFEKLHVEDSHVVLAGGRRLPVRASVSKAESRVRFWLAVPGSVVVDGTMKSSLDGGRATVKVFDLDGETIAAAIRTYVAEPPVAIPGKVSGRIAASWEEGEEAHGFAWLEIAGGSVEDASDAKLTIASGVFIGEASIGPATRPTLAVKVDRADLATSELQAFGVAGAVTLTDLSPPTSAPRQKLSAQRLKIGQTEFANGQLEFELNASGDIFVRQTRWDFLGGQVYANDVSVPRDGPVSLTLRAENVELRNILATYAKNKLDGRGKISGELPIVIDGPKIAFGEGRLTSLTGGHLRIKDPQTLAQVSEVAGGAAAQAVAERGGSTEQIKQDIAEALKDFEYDEMTAKLTNDPDGLAAYVIIKGHGRTGAKQRLVYEPRIHRLDQLLRLYLDLMEATDRPAPHQPRPTTGKVKSK